MLNNTQTGLTRSMWQDWTHTHTLSLCAQVGWFLHTPFPSSEIYRTLPVREEVLRATLRADLIGFHTYDYARHFISSCTRILGLEGTPEGVEDNGRCVGVLWECGCVCVLGGLGFGSAPKAATNTLPSQPAALVCAHTYGSPLSQRCSCGCLPHWH